MEKKRVYSSDIEKERVYSSDIVIDSSQMEEERVYSSDTEEERLTPHIWRKEECTLQIRSR